MLFQVEKVLPTPESVSAWAELIDKYGFSMIAAVVLMIIVLAILFMFIKGMIVPRIYLDRAEKDRDRLQRIMEKERVQIIAPVLEVVNTLMKDKSDNRGG